MTTFDDRERAFENKYAHDEEMQFRAYARRNRLLGLWAAEQMGRSGEAAADYARSIVIEDLKEKGDDDVLRRVLDDLHQAGKPVEASELRRKMDALLAEAKAEVFSESDA